MNTTDIDLRALLDQLEQPLIRVAELVVEDEPDEAFDGTCALHDGCRSIR